MPWQSSEQTQRAKSLRAKQTEAEGLLWAVLRRKQLSDMKFRRQHPIGPYLADFACVAQRLVVELDGEYHDATQKSDLRRQQFIESQGWKVVRFSNEEVLRDVEPVLIAIASYAGIAFSFRKRTEKRSGMKSEHATNQSLRSPPDTPHPAAPASDLPGGEVKDV
jgi:very-short-patch-repair endonuclease